MSNMTILLRSVTLVCAFVSVVALPPKAIAQNSPMAAEKIQAKEAAVEAHAARKRGCKAEAKERGLHLKERHAYIKGCMQR
jgi:hypothetical protein